MVYVPKKAPPLALDLASLQNFANWIEQEFGAVAREGSETVTLELRVSYREPVRPRDGMIVFADGTSWNPGSGRGAYIYDGGWNLVLT